MNTIFFQSRQVTPSKILCVGRNYTAHIEELNNEVPENMVVFSKPNSSISGTLSSQYGEQLHYEAEICFLFERGDFAAIGLGLDLTKRGLQSELKKKGLPWERCKAFDGSAVFSEFVPINGPLGDYSLELHINGKLIQKGGVPLMIYKPHQILEELLTFTTLIDGDIIMTGTPKGVGIINSGDIFEGSILNSENVVTQSRWVAS